MRSAPGHHGPMKCQGDEKLTNLGSGGMFMTQGKDKIFALALCNANKMFSAEDKELSIERRRGQTDGRPGDSSQITKEMLIQSFKYSLIFHRDRHMQINGGGGQKKYNSTLLIKTFKKYP